MMVYTQSSQLAAINIKKSCRRRYYVVKKGTGADNGSDQGSHDD